MNSLALFVNRAKQWLAVSVCIAALAVLLPETASAARKTFASPEEAVKYLVAAVRASDLKEIMTILGPGSKGLISSGDETADKTGREKFLAAYDRLNSLKEESADKRVLLIGEDNWPMPIPVAKKGTAWFFDIQKGKREILSRRIGRNELHVIDVLHTYVDAQHEYASKDCRGGGKVEFAQKLISTKGSRDGLYWEAQEGEEESPLGPLIAQAAREGYGRDTDLSPFHGYYFKILTGQGKNAEGGAYNYVVKGKMLLGFAILAYPARYGNSGVMTFMVNQQGIIYEKNLGRDTKRIAEAMKVFNPDKTWKKVEGDITAQME